MEGTTDMKKNIVTKALIVALSGAALMTASSVHAEDVNSTVTATVANAFTLAETQALSFGSIVAISDGSDTSTMVIDNAGAVTVNNPGAATIIELSGAQQGIFDITGAAPSTTMTLTLPASVTLTCGTCSGSQPDFTVDTITNDVAGAPATDGTGAATINIGATLNTIADANPYEDGDYTGTMTVSVNY